MSENQVDLTPEEARAEVEAFMGEEWTVIAPPRDGTEDAGEECYVSAWRGVVGSHAFAPTYRAAVSALKQAWRDAVRPVAERGVVFGLADLHHSADPAVVRQEYAKRIPFLTSLSLGEEA